MAREVRKAAGYIERRRTMSEQEFENGEDSIDEEGRNATQRQIDGDEPAPGAEQEWEETNDEPAQGEVGQDAV
jgi:hypothetical protein